MSFAGSDDEDTYWLADVHVQWPLAAPRCTIPRHTELRVRLSDRRTSRYRLIARRGKTEQATTTDPTLADMQALMDEIGPPGTTLSDSLWLAAFRLHHRKVARFRIGHAFLAGDAAHIHSPAGGQGMNTGIQDADNLAWKLALVIQGRAHVALLDSYDQERGAVATQVLKQTDLMFRAVTVQSGILRAIRNRLVPLLLSRHAFIRRMQRTLGELDIRYGRSPFVAEHGRQHGPRVGTRAPDAPLVIPSSGGATSLWRICQSDTPLQSTLLLFGGRTPSASDMQRLAEIGQMVRDRYHGSISVHLIATGNRGSGKQIWDGPRYDDPAAVAHKCYRITAPTAVLIRPDGYIGYRGQAAGDDALRAYLEHLFVPQKKEVQ